MKQEKTKKRPFYKHPLMIVLYIFIGWSVFIVIMNSKEDKTKKDSVNTQTVQTQRIELPTEIAPEVPTIKWKYSSYKDEMTGGTNKYAKVVAENKINFQFPYNIDGGSTFTFTFRRKGKDLDAYLEVDKGQFICSFSHTKYRVKFDEESPISFTMSPSSSYNSTIVFFKYPKKLLNKIKKAKKMMIEGQFFQEGNHNIKFDVEGLEFE